MKTHALIGTLGLLFLAQTLAADEPKKVEAKVREIAGVAEFLRGVPKHFATLQAVDPARHRVTLLIDGETLAKTWDLMPDAEVKVSGWWGRLDQFVLGDRVWVWFQTDRKKQPIAVMMICDEPSEQDIHESAWTLTSAKPDSVTLHPVKGADRNLKTASPAALAVGARVRFQSAGGTARVLMDEAEFEKRREQQKLVLRKRWEAAGLPGTVTFLHLHSGEMELMLDHEAMRWGRALKPGDSVSIVAQPPIPAVVREMKPWRERTQLRLVAASNDQVDLRIGQRIRLKMPAPPPAVVDSPLPPDVGRLKARQERVEWFLASTYCTCKVRGNICTGHFYTLASCNPNGCAQPDFIRKQVGQLIDEGKSDEQIFQVLLKQEGPRLLLPHLLP